MGVHHCPGELQRRASESTDVHACPRPSAENGSQRAGALYGPRVNADSLTLELLGYRPTASDDRQTPLADTRLYVNPVDPEDRPSWHANKSPTTASNWPELST